MGTLYSWSAVERSWASDNTKLVCPAFRCFFLGLGTGVISSDRLRPATGGRSSGCPSLSKAWCREGTSYGEFKIGSSKKLGAI